jgi:hypothetical protein
METDEILTGDRRERLRRARVRPAIGVEAVDEPIEHDSREVLRIVVADLQSGQHLVPLSLNLLGGERGIARNIGHEIQREIETVLHHDGLDEGEIGAGPGSDHTADRIDGRGNLFGAARRRALVEDGGREGGHTGLVVRIKRAAGANQ